MQYLGLFSVSFSVFSVKLRWSKCHISEKNKTNTFCKNIKIGSGWYEIKIKHKEKYFKMSKVVLRQKSCCSRFINPSMAKNGYRCTFKMRFRNSDVLEKFAHRIRFENLKIIWEHLANFLMRYVYFLIRNIFSINFFHANVSKSFDVYLRINLYTNLYILWKGTIIL